VFKKIDGVKAAASHERYFVADAANANWSSMATIRIL